MSLKALSFICNQLPRQFRCTANLGATVWCHTGRTGLEMFTVFSPLPTSSLTPRQMNDSEWEQCVFKWNSTPVEAMFWRLVTWMHYPFSYNRHPVWRVSSHPPVTTYWGMLCDPIPRSPELSMRETKWHVWDNSRVTKNDKFQVIATDTWWTWTRGKRVTGNGRSREVS